MSAAITAHRTQPPAEPTYDRERPYRDCPLIELIEWLETQYSRGESSHELVVWELAARAAEAEQLTAR
ncbi:MAG: hypothetical protein ACRD0K_28035 [Egibacteraceae bacterium]